MHDDAMVPFALFTFLTLIIVLPIYWRHKQYAAQLDVIAKALEKGIDPATIQLKLPQQEQAGDPNGNWKAGLILIAIGLFLFLCVVLPGRLLGEIGTHDEGDIIASYAVPGMFFILGSVLMFVHYTIVGKVVKRGERRTQLNGGTTAELPL
jgi:hypothetical protein